MRKEIKQIKFTKENIKDFTPKNFVAQLSNACSKLNNITKKKKN